MKTIDIFYKSYAKDFEWLYLSLQSIDKYVTGYDEVVIIIPAIESHLFDYTKINDRTTVITIDEKGNGYLFQQWVKMSAHQYCGSDYILFSDSDCIFDHHIDLQFFIKDDKPEILYTHYDKVGDAICWKQPTEAFIDQPIEWEFMRRNCLIYHTKTIEKIYNTFPNLKHTILTSERFSEFNAIGAWAWVNDKDKYNFVNTDDWIYVEPKGKQFWSWGGLDKSIDEIKKILA